MARYVDAVDLPVSVEAAFDFFAEFSRTAEWDPGVVEAEKLDAGPPQIGSRFRVVAAFLGRRIPLEYRIVELARPERIVLEADADSLRSIDVIDFAPRGAATRVTYEARLELAGWQRIADPLLHMAFQVIGRNAMRGLERYVAEHGVGSTRSRAA